MNMFEIVWIHFSALTYDIVLYRQLRYMLQVLVRMLINMHKCLANSCYTL